VRPHCATRLLRAALSATWIEITRSIDRQHVHVPNTHTSRVLLPFACSPAGDNHDRERCELSGRQVRARARLGPGSVRFLSSMSVSA